MIFVRYHAASVGALHNFGKTVPPNSSIAESIALSMTGKDGSVTKPTSASSTSKLSSSSSSNSFFFHSPRKITQRDIQQRHTACTLVSKKETSLGRTCNPSVNKRETIKSRSQETFFQRGTNYSHPYFTTYTLHRTTTTTTGVAYLAT